MNVSPKKASSDSRQQQTTYATLSMEHKKLKIEQFSESDCEIVSKTKLNKVVFAYFLQ